VRVDGRRWSTVLIAALVVLDVLVLGVAVRARSGTLPSWQVQDPRFDVSAAATDDDEGSSAAGDTGSTSVLLAVNPAGLVLRAVRGACQERFTTRAQVAVGRAEDGDLNDVELPGLREALGVMVFADGNLRVTGLGADCAPVTFDSSDEGDTWQPSDVAGIWHLDGDVTAQRVIGPAGAEQDIGCAPQNIVNLPGRRAIVSCTATGFYELQVGARPVLYSANEVQQLSATTGAAPGHFFAFGAVEGCGAAVNDVDAAAEGVVKRLACLGADRAPLAIASSGKWVVAQAGEDLLVSTDGGKHFS
jgi:hypothetical protein